MSQSLTITLTGTTDLPPGKIASIVTSLEMLERPAERADPPGTEGFALAPIDRGDVERYLRIYRSLGERWMWFSRLGKPRAELATLFADPAVELYAARFDGRDVGLLELDFRVPREGELAFFGLDEPVVGKGAGRWLMNRALALAWARPISRFWVHTCTLDHPGALAFYRRSGFTVFKRGIEVDDDPRLTGELRADAVGHHPIIA